MKGQNRDVGVAPSRLSELDGARGVALVCMLISNFVTVLAVVGLFETRAYDAWWWLAHLTGIAFVFIAGVSATLSAARAAEHGPRRVVAVSIRRGAWVLLWALVVSGATWLALGDLYVRWGVLHLIGFALIAAIPVLGKPRLALVLGAVTCLWGYSIADVRVDSAWWVWLGYRAEGFNSVDYFPAAPWFGYFLLGIYAGHGLYPEGARAFAPAIGARFLGLPPLRWLGTHTLVIYLLHQPVYLLVLVLTGFVPLALFIG